MADPVSTIITSAAAILLSSGASSLTTTLAIFRDLRNRMKLMEERLGKPKTPTEVPSGLHKDLHALTEFVHGLEEMVRRLQKDLHSFEDAPPEWVTRAISRARNSSSVNMEVQQEFEARIEARFKTLQDRLMRELEEARRHPSEHHVADSKYVTVDTYMQDSRRRADELSSIKENLAAANGLLRGVLGALGLIGPDNGRH